MRPFALRPAPVALSCGLLMAVCGLGTTAGAAPAGANFTNPVSRGFADTYADPSVIQGKDGWWYAYATADPLRSGDQPGIGHIARTKDWATWDYVGTIFTEANRPTWAQPSAGLWAPDIRYIDGRYVMYFTVTDTTLNPGEDSAIGVATSNSPAGPWVPADEPVVAPRGNGDGGYFWTFDPSGFTGRDGRQWLYYGSYYGGVHVVPLSPDGLRAAGEATQLTAWDRYEGAYVVEHAGWYYLMGSSANCCAGPATGYSVFAGRSRSPQGPFLDAEGLDLNASVTGGTTVLTQNGNTWVGAGHNAFFTDAQGRDFLAYHAIDKGQPWLNEPFGINRRPMLIDRVDWIDGWPRVRAGNGPSDTPQPLPVTRSLLGGDPAAPATAFGGMRAATDPQGGVTARVDGTAASKVAAPAGALRARMDVRAEQKVTVTLGQSPRRVKVVYDGPARQLRAWVLQGQTIVAKNTSPLPAGTGWRALSLEVDGDRVSTQVSAGDLNDPMATAATRSPGFRLKAAPVRVTGSQVQVDNLTVQSVHRETAQAAPAPQAGEVLFREEFSGGLDASWAWVRPEGEITVADGDLRWPLRNADLVGGGNTGALLLREMPDEDWIAETSLTLDLGEQSVRNYQQAGLVVHRNDDDFARLGSVAIWNTRTVEYGRELAVAPGDARTSYGGAIIGAPSPTMTMRIAHSRNAAGEHVYRAGIRREGGDWVWGAAWTFPGEAAPRLGLYAGGGENPATTAVFHDFTLYRLAR